MDSITQQPDRQPVLVGCGQIHQANPDPHIGANPMDLTAQAARLAASDAGAGPALLQALDTLVVIRSFGDTSWRFACPFGSFANPPKSVANRIGADNLRQLIYTEAGGNMPQWSVNELARQIASGKVEAAMIAGGESLATQKAAQRLGRTLDWNEDPGSTPQSWGISRRGWSDLEDRHGMRGAIYAYPLFENAIRGHRNLSLDAHQQAMARLLAGFAQVAANNPLADRRAGYDAATIATVSDTNPMIGFPYTRLMNANAFIDQSAAVILTSVGKAKALGINPEQFVYLHGCADAHDHWYITDRRDFYSSPAMAHVFRETFAMAGKTIHDMDAIDIYSCFPSAVEVACDTLGLSEDDPRGLTITGGLPYFGGPGNNYVTHSIAQMMLNLRAKRGTFGLVTANGNYLTKHSAGIYSTEPVDHQNLQQNAVKTQQVQQALDATAHPVVTELASGPATVETWTVINDRQGPQFAIVIGRLTDNSRFIANTPSDPALLQQMQQSDYLGCPGQVSNDGKTNLFKPS
ncbi:MAG: acetyl-CoA acetyltransferase [Burkholderiaceae bacterium]